MKNIILGFLSFLFVISYCNADVYYVDASRPDDSGAATNWATAKQTIQAAIDAASFFDTVLVTNGVYNSGGAITVGGSISNRVALTNGITLKAADGCEPIIDGENSMRCLFMTNSTRIIGFVLRNGAVDLTSSDAIDNSGAGVFMHDSCTVDHCEILDCSATRGAGVYARGGGTVENSIIISNNSTLYGGGSYLWKGGKMINSLVERNSATNGGGVYFYQPGGKIINCTTRNNSADNYGNELDFVDGGIVQNCIAWNNNGSMDRGYRAESIEYTCAKDGVTNGVNGCITNSPLFAAATGDQLSTNSPCINSGNNNVIYKDFDRRGAVRIFENTVDMGSFESPGTSLLKIDDYTFNVQHNSSDSKTIFLQNINNMFCDWNVTTSLSNGLSISSTNGFLKGSPYGSYTGLLFSVDATQLTAGTYISTNIFTATHMQGVVTQYITITVTDSDLFINNFDFSAEYNGSNVSHSLSLTNAGSADANWVVANQENWLSISATNGVLAPNSATNLIFDVDPTGLMPDTYYSTNIFTASSMSGSFTQLVSLTVLSSELSISNYAFYSQRNSPKNKKATLELHNSGAAKADWHISGTPSWLNIIDDNGILPGNSSTSLVFEASAGSLAVGTYVATNIFAAPSSTGVFTQKVYFTITDYDYYVTTNGNDSNSGTNWNCAKASITSAVEAQETPYGNVFVSNGVYKYGYEIVITNHIILQSVNGPTVTIIDGDNVHRCLSVITNSIIEGFSFINGLADGTTEEEQVGGGLYCDNITLRNCIFRNNRARRAGGGLAANSSFIHSNKFFNNTVEGIAIYGGAGGGAAIGGRNPYIDDSLFVSNSAHYGGGLSISNTAVRDCSFSNNTAYIYGGGVFIEQEGDLRNVTFTNNTADIDGGGLYMNNGGYISSATFTGNRANERGGGVYIADNDTNPDNDAECWYLNLYNNSAGIRGGGAYLWHGGMITRSTIKGNSAGAHGGGIAFRKSGGVYRSTIANNIAVTNGGGVYFSDGGYLRESKLFENQAARGAGAYLYLDGNIKNSLFVGNTADKRGGAIYCYKGGGVNGVTISSNSATEYGTGFYAYNGGTIENAIIWDGTDAIYRSGSNIVARYICTSDSITNGMENVITNNPLFMDSAVTNYQLKSLSSCINAGTNNNGRSIDLALSSRISGSIIDLGAYEWSFDDNDGDGIADAWETEYFGSTTNKDANSIAANGTNTILECYIANLDPTDSNSIFNIFISNDNSNINFASSFAREYRLLIKTNILDASWIPVTPFMQGNDTIMSITPLNNNQCEFYKAETKLP